MERDKDGWPSWWTLNFSREQPFVAAQDAFATFVNGMFDPVNKDDKWYASIKDGYTEALCLDFDVCDETAFGLIDSDEFMELKNLHGEYEKSKGQL